MTGPPESGDVLSLDDVDAMPHGLATIYRVAADPQHREVRLASPTQTGLLRSVDAYRDYFSENRCEVLGVAD